MMVKDVHCSKKNKAIYLWCICICQSLKTAYQKKKKERKNIWLVKNTKKTNGIPLDCANFVLEINLEISSDVDCN